MTDEPDLLGEWPDEWLPDEEPPDQSIALLPMLGAAVVLVVITMIVLSLMGALSWSA